MHAPIWAGTRRADRLPHADGIEQRNRRGCKRDDTQVDVVVDTPWRQRARFDHGDVKAFVRQLQRQRCANHAGTDHGDVVYVAPACCSRAEG
jgi:hypothetical protein